MKYKVASVHLNGLLNLCVFLLFLLVPITSKAGFCWSTDGTQVCNVNSQSNQGNPLGSNGQNDHLLGTIDPDYDLERGWRRDILFRSDCHTQSSGCGGQRWELEYIEFYHLFDGEITYAPQPKLSLELNLETGKIEKDNWLATEILSGNNSGELKDKGVSGSMYLTFSLTKSQLAELAPGTHRFTFLLRGSDVEDTQVHRYIYFPFSFFMPEIKKVQISGLSTVSFGSFPLDRTSIDQKICIYANVDNKYTIKAGSGNGGTDFRLKSENDHTIAYEPRIGSIGSSQLSPIPTALTDLGLSGSSVLDCGGVPNTKLEVGITDTFGTLSTKPAGTYIDTLTITVAAD